jgi:hypothetical protein
MIRRSFASLAFVALVLGACHSNGPPSTSMPDPMGYPMYRSGPTAQAPGNRSRTSAAIAACTSVTRMRSTPSGCSTAR